jgi:hypothetical protein
MYKGSSTLKIRVGWQPWEKSNRGLVTQLVIDPADSSGDGQFGKGICMKLISVWRRTVKNCGRYKVLL